MTEPRTVETSQTDVRQRSPKPLVVMRNICRSFNGIPVLDNVNLKIVPGEIHALVGENGAGKSTLVKVLSGVLAPTGGTIQIEGERVQFNGPREAEEAGIVIIHQELSLVPEMSVAENVTLGHEPLIGNLIVDRSQALMRTSSLLKRFGFRIDPSRQVKNLRVGEQQLIEIARALLMEARLLIMDEPTSALSQTEADVLMEVIRDLALQDAAILYISHRMDEVFEIADQITVLRDGSLIDTVRATGVTPGDVVEMMVGRKIPALDLNRGKPVVGTPRLSVDALTLECPNGGPRLLDDVSLEVHSGEILGLAGLLGAGRTELLETVFGTRSGDFEGVIKIDGEPAKIESPNDALERGLALITEDRKSTGLILDATISKNIALPSLAAWSRFWIPSATRKLTAALKAIEDLNISCRGPEHVARLLSGGNQQKVVLGKWLATKPGILLLDEPTRGIDVGAKDEIYQLIEDLADNGLAILMASSELTELVALCDRIVVLCEGRVTGALKRSQFEIDAIKRLAMQFHY